MEFQLEKSAASAGKNCINTNQIKSATDNAGEFSAGNGCILHQSDNIEELSNRISRLIESPAVDISLNETTSENMLSEYQKIKEATNKQSGDKVWFGNGAFGKIVRHNNYDPRIIGSLKELFEDSVFLGKAEPDFDTPRADGTVHKVQNNIEAFSYYLNKVTIDRKEYLIRFTVHDLKHKPWKPQTHNFHSQQLTNLRTKKNGASNVSTLAMWADEVAASDSRLATYLSKVKEYRLT